MVTGANGFVGSEFLAEISRRRHNGCGFVARSAVRTMAYSSPPKGDCFVVGEIDAKTNWLPALSGVAVVVHLAARAHVLTDEAKNPLTVFRETNVDGTMNLAKQALQVGIRRFIFVSSIGVNGNRTTGHEFKERDEPNPQGPYAITKMEAEVALRSLFAGSQTQLVIVRPPLVYGPNAPGNFGRLLKLSSSGLPLPLAGVHNKRSLLALGNLVDFLILCVDHPAAAHQTFLVSDGQDLSTPYLIQSLATAMGKRVRLFFIPVWMLKAGAIVLGKRNVVDRLCDDLQIDISKARQLLDWSPPISVQEGVRRAVQKTPPL